MELPLDSHGLPDLAPPCESAHSTRLERIMCSASGDTSGPALASAVLVFGDVTQEALSLGIPQRALPSLPSPLTVEGVRAATDLMQRIIASRLSSNL